MSVDKRDIIFLSPLFSVINFAMFMEQKRAGSAARPWVGFKAVSLCGNLTVVHLPL